MHAQVHSAVLRLIHISREADGQMRAPGFMLLLMCLSIGQTAAQEAQRRENVDYWGNLISVAANVGIIVGLVLVALQLRQNASLARIQILSQDISDERAAEIGMFGDAGAVAWVVEARVAARL